MIELIKIILLCLIAHHLGDYYLQNGFLAAKKAGSYYYTFIHCLIYGTPFVVIWLIFLEKDLFVFRYILIIWALHIPVDLGKCYLTINKDKLVQKGHKIVGRTNLIYLLDQLVHALTIVGIMMYIYPYLITMKLNLLDSCSISLIAFFLYFILGFQVYYVTIRKITKREREISNWYSSKDLKLKLISAVSCSLIVINKYTIIILAIIYTLYRNLNKRADKEVDQYVIYTIGMTIILSLIRNVIYLIIM